MEIDKNNMMKLPIELVRIIADYHDYEKYCLPVHKCNFKSVIEDILIMSEIIKPTLIPSLVYVCWGKGWDNYEINLDNEHIDMLTELIQN